MAELTPTHLSQGVFGTKAGPQNRKSEHSDGSAGNSPPHPCPKFRNLIFVQYNDHVLYNRTNAIAMKPQTRETVGWLVYECGQYLIISWDRDADPPTLKNGDPKASGIVILKADIIASKKLEIKTEISHENTKWRINSTKTIVKGEYALQPKKRKTHKTKNSKGEN